MLNDDEWPIEMPRQLLVSWKKSSNNLSGAQGVYRNRAGSALVFISFGKVELSKQP
jgi:hypothetical protein